MQWLIRYRLRNYMHDSLWLAPSVSMIVVLLASPVVRWIDERYQWRVFDYAPDGARALLSAIAPATLTLIALVLSTLLLAVQLASSQMSPRLIAQSLARTQIKVCLSIFVISYTYCAGVVGRVEERVPQVPATLAILLTLLSIVAGLYLVDFLAKELRPVRVLARTALLGRDVIEQTYPVLLAHDGRPEEPPTPPTDVASVTIESTRRSGVLLAMDTEGIVEMAREADCMVEVLPQVGDFVARDDALLRIYPASAAQRLDRRQLQRSFAFGQERTIEQDPGFIFRILVDVAAKALSPAINDPTSAVLALDQIHHLLLHVGRRRLDTGLVRDAAGKVRLLYQTPNWEDFVLLAVTEIRQYGATSIQIARRLHAMLLNLVTALPERRVRALRDQLDLLHEGVAASFATPAERLCAQISDYQGLGSSRPTTAG